MVLFEIHQRFTGHFLNELRVSFKAFIKPFEAPQRSVKINILSQVFLFVRDLGEKG